ncbi:MAG TPA: ATP-binding cassette domain-containing protein, partial [Thermoanaerobaculia bacterium]|nr:ATP-binding cassette domain-containing protein [Thermoanaerobaculia bacterium]
MALVGPSGCGKTTALRLVNRLLEADAGSVRVFGRDVREEDPVGLRRRIGYVIQEGGLFPHWSVANNIEIVPRLLGWTPERRRVKSEELLAMVNLPYAEFAGRS